MQSFIYKILIGLTIIVLMYLSYSYLKYAQYFAMIAILLLLMMWVKNILYEQRLKLWNSFIQEMDDKGQDMNWLQEKKNELIFKREHGIANKRLYNQQLSRVNSAIDNVEKETDTSTAAHQSLKFLGQKVDYLRIVDVLFLKYFEGRYDKKEVMIAFGELIGEDLSDYSGALRGAYIVDLSTNQAFFDELKAINEKEWLKRLNKTKK